ncbi:lipoyl-protein ligase [uncultured Desulfobacterium sp.]|uniref:Octanoyltransferase n=1 Tax=uncultured Desulfobacterium sp. TaxID=201089 RepID=A0A445MSW3_9BACT|nr:lipoyl-protein ligase [uncultured Desulfobacterium sp.]
MKCLVYVLGLIEYGESCRMQRQLMRMRMADSIPDVLLLLEHPPTLTVGKTGRIENILTSAEQLRKEGISLFFSDRGGDVTYHGPGQMVAYPILSLKNRGKDVHLYVHNLEEVVIRTLKDFAIDADRDKNHPGVWIDRKEIAAIGLRIEKWTTMHGLALNVNSNLSHFSLINPCGFTERKVTSMSKILGREMSMETVISRFIPHFSEIFETVMESGSPA